MSARCHVPSGSLSPEVLAASDAGAEIIQHPAGRNNVIIARARADAENLGGREIPFGMECDEAIIQTRAQVANLPFGDFERLVVPVGSGMSVAGILWGLRDLGEQVPVLGVVVGASPEKRLAKYAPPNWREMLRLIPSGSDYHDEAEVRLGDLLLDPHYEAKCVPFLEDGDLLWVVGIRQTAC